MHSFPLIQYESFRDQTPSRCQFLSSMRRNFKPQSTARNNLNNGMQISHSARDFRRKANPDCDVFYFANARAPLLADLVSRSRKGWSLQLSDKTATLKRLSARRHMHRWIIPREKEKGVLPLAGGGGCLGARGSGAGAQPKRIEQNDDDTLKGARTMIKRSRAVLRRWLKVTADRISYCSARLAWSPERGLKIDCEIHYLFWLIDTIASEAVIERMCHQWDVGPSALAENWQPGVEKVLSFCREDFGIINILQLLILHLLCSHRVQDKFICDLLRTIDLI
jgi:hypothetical protein